MSTSLAEQSNETTVRLPVKRVRKGNVRPKKLTHIQEPTNELFPTAGSVRLDNYIDISEINSSLRTPIAREKFITALDELNDIERNCKVGDWDGYDAEPINPSALKESRAFLNLLPPHLRVPFVVPQASGSISLEWRNPEGRLFLVNLSGKGVINFVGLFGINRKVRGSEPFTSHIPNTIKSRLSLYFK